MPGPAHLSIQTQGCNVNYAVSRRFESHPVLGRYLRLTVRSAAQNDRLLAALNALA